jgi:subtilisin family serine protease
MKKIITITSLCTCILNFLFISSVLGNDKLDSFLESSINSNEYVVMGKALSLSSSVEAAFDETTEVFIKSAEVDYTADTIREMGGLVHIKAGNVISATVPKNSVSAIASEDEVEFIEAAKPIGVLNDVAAGEIGSAEVHRGTNLPKAYSGKNVIIGIIDTGIDYSHSDFRDESGKSRILSIWNQTKNGGAVPTEIEDSYGTECDQNSISDGSCPLMDRDGHGTHVAGTAAARNKNYPGIAPDANLIVVSYDSSVNLQSGYAETIFSTKICQAAYYIFKKAETLGLPAVINLSLGTHIGPHDGSSLFEQCLAGLLEDSAGRAIVAAAGNEFSTEEGFKGIHAGYSVDGTNASNFVIRKLTNDRIYYLDFWGEPGSDLSVGLAFHDGKPRSTPQKYSGLIKAGQKSEGSFEDGAIQYFINYSESKSALNGKPHAGIRIKVNSLVGNISEKSFDLIVSGKGSFNAWLFPDKPARTVQFTDFSAEIGSEWTYVPGDSNSTVAMPATSPDIIAVGAYATRVKWGGGIDCCEIPIFSLGELLPFSASGPSAALQQTGIKPDITAPGGMIASTLSAQSNPNDVMLMNDGKHVLNAGTSMAAPMVTGTVALMFSADPNYTYSDVKKYLIESAYADEPVGTVPNDRWGHGKLDVLAAVETAVNGGATGHFSGNSSLGIPSSESDSGKSGCQLVISATTGSGDFVIIAMMALCISGIAIARFNRRRSYIS